MKDRPTDEGQTIWINPILEVYFNHQSDRGTEVDYVNLETDHAEQKLTTFQSPVQYCKKNQKNQKF